MRRLIALRQTQIVRDQRGIQQQMEQLFQLQLGHPAPLLATREQAAWHPPADVYETDTAIIVQIELPGMYTADIEVTLEGQVLHVAGVRPARQRERPQCYHQMGINTGRFELEVFLARLVDAAAVSAHYDDGFLTVTLPKS